MIGYILLGLGVLVTLRILLLIDNPQRDFTQNHAEFVVDSADPQLRPLLVSGTVSEVVDGLQKWIAKQPRWEEVSATVENADGVQELHLTRTTPLLRFVDDIHVRLTPQSPPDAPSQVRIDAESQSRLGKGDLGQNPRNLRELRSAF